MMAGRSFHNFIMIKRRPFVRPRSPLTEMQGIYARWTILSCQVRRQRTPGGTAENDWASDCLNDEDERTEPTRSTPSLVIVNFLFFKGTRRQLYCCCDYDGSSLFRGRWTRAGGIQFGWSGEQEGYHQSEYMNEHMLLRLLLWITFQLS